MCIINYNTLHMHVYTTYKIDFMLFNEMMPEMLAFKKYLKRKPGMVVFNYNPNIWEVEPGARSQARLCRKFKANLGHMKSYSKNWKTKLKQKEEPSRLGLVLFF